MTPSADAPLVSWALFYASLGWPVFPLRPQTKDRPVTTNGHLNATTRTDVIEAWWASNPDLNIGLPTGYAFDAIDIDSPEGEDYALVAGTPTFGPISRTSKGIHILVQPTGFAIAQSKQLVPGIDFRGRTATGSGSGYIVAPPSVHPSGHVYHWAQDPERPIPPAPDWFLALLQRKHVLQIAQQIIQQHAASGPATAYENEDIVATAQAIGLRVSRSMKARCPFSPHSADNQSLQLYPTDNHFHCHSCGAHGWSQQMRSGQVLHR